jgi:hypothetical protein
VKRLATSVALLLTLAFAFAIGTSAKAPAGDPVRERVGSWSFVTPLAPVSQVAIKGGGSIGVDANTCRGCHPDNYREWSLSTHAHALDDPQYIAELAKPEQPRWLCLNCHIPNANQRRQLIDENTRVLSPGHDLSRIDERPNPAFDEKLQHEAITCASCHVRPGEGGLGVIVGARGDTAAPHVTRKGRAELRDVCVRCHSPGHGRISPTFVCWFETSEEIAQGSFAGQKDCVDCHMPEVERSVAPGYPARKTRQHHWLGGGVPKSYDLFDALPDHGWQSALDVKVVIREAHSNGVVVDLHNARAAHMIPTGDPERHFVVRARLLDDKGVEIGRSTTRIGQRWDWGDNATGRVAHRVEETRLRPDETRSWRPGLGGDDWARAAKLVVDALHVRLSPSNARYSKKASVDEELRRLAPAASKRVPAIERHYPLLSFVSREEIDVRTGARARDDTRALIARSKRLQGAPLAQIEQMLAPRP